MIKSSVINSSASAMGLGKPLVHFWSECVGAGRANEGLRANWLEHLELVARECGFKYLRFHGIFHDDMFVYTEKDGKGVYNWQYVDELFDRMLAMGVRPLVELAFCPGAMASCSEPKTFWWKAWGCPPSDYGKWAELVSQFARHCIARYGLEEVLTWPFEVWNEPNLDYFWLGTRSQYFELYRVSCLALKKIDTRLQVGGPATSTFMCDHRYDGEVANDDNPLPYDPSMPFLPVWVNEFIAYCHANSLPMDFISTHPYPAEFPFDPHGLLGGKSARLPEAAREDLTMLREIIDASPYPQAKIHLTEWSSSPSSRDFTHDVLPEATFIVKTNVDASGLADSLSYWTFTDVFEEGGAGPTVFHGGFGMINFQGIVKPSFHGYRMLNQLGDEELTRSEGVIVTRRRRDGAVVALAYHFPPEQDRSLPTTKTFEDGMAIMTIGQPRPLHLELTDLPPRAPFEIEILDSDHANAAALWDTMGRPEPPTREQTAALRKQAMQTDLRVAAADENGRLVIDRMMSPWSVVLVRQLA